MTMGLSSLQMAVPRKNTLAPNGTPRTSLNNKLLGCAFPSAVKRINTFVITARDLQQFSYETFLESIEPDCSSLLKRPPAAFPFALRSNCTIQQLDSTDRWQA